MAQVPTSGEDRVQEGVGAVIVTFNPDLEKLRVLTDIYLRQVELLVVVDNTPGGAAIAAYVDPAVAIIREGHNVGIATAFNHGLDFLLQRGCRFLVTSDQDSVPEPDMVAQLLAAHGRLEQAGKSPGAVGACFVDPRDGALEYFRVVDWQGARFEHGIDAQGCVPASFLISSGCMTSREVLQRVGMMRDALFIDCVDIEWCYRAGALGLPVYGVPAAKMHHTIGDEVVSYWFLHWRKRPIHSVFRVYYQFRNYCLLLRMGHVSASWKFWMGRAMLVQIFIYLFLVRKNKLSYLRRAWAGVRDGLLGRGGPG